MLEDRDLATLPDASMRALRGGTVGMVFQEPMVSLNPAMTIGAQLIEGLLLHERIKPYDARDRAMEMLRRVQIADPAACLSSYPHQFSGGMRQRIMLASVMLLKPKLLIADEPTTALDSLSQREVMEIMADLTRTMGTAVLLVTHDLHLVERYANTVVVLKRGDLIEAGSAQEVLRSPRDSYTRSLINALPRRNDSRPPIPLAEPLIEARGVSVAYPGTSRMFARAEAKQVVHEVSLAIMPGEVVAVVGGSGSGKTSFGRALIGLSPLSAGEIFFRGHSLRDTDRRQRRAFRLDCQMVFQDPYSSLDPRQRVRQIVAEPLRHANDMTQEQRAARVDETLRDVGLEELGARFPHALSGGQRQRVAIARALVRRPALVIADEPVSALDMTIQKQVLELLQRLQAQHGFACLFISHNLAAVSSIADRIVVMSRGKIVEQGSVKQIFDNPQHAYTRTLLDAAYVDSSLLAGPMSAHANTDQIGARLISAEER